MGSRKATKCTRVKNQVVVFMWAAVRLGYNAAGPSSALYRHPKNGRKGVSQAVFVSSRELDADSR